MPSKHTPLPHTISGSDSRAPIVLIHGFAGDRLAWATIEPQLAGQRRTIAFDLPGHGEARDWPRTGNAKVAADALIASLKRLELPLVHLVGHSMGGAVAALVALKRPRLVASLTLLAPGGIGPQINARLLRRFASVETEQDISVVVEQFFGFAKPVPDGLVALMAEVRADRKLIASFEAVCATLVDGDIQKTLPVADLAEAPYPIKVVWGEQDHIVPVTQIASFPANVARHILPGVGHLPHVEEPELIARLILEQAAGG